MKVVGYCTGNFDLLHPDHLDLLKNCKKHCDHLVVGVTTDELATATKRTPILSFDHRCALLRAVRYVDEVTPHPAVDDILKPTVPEPKQKAHERIQFHVLLTTDEYRGTPEMTTFKKDMPHIPIVYLQKGKSTSTSEILPGVLERATLNARPSTLAMGITGPIISVGNLVFKTINLSKEEYDTAGTTMEDVFGMYNRRGPIPRNGYEGAGLNDFPLITGVHGMREVAIMEHCQRFSWSTFVCYNLNVVGRTDVVCKDVVTARRFPKAVITVVSRNAGITLDEFLRKKPAPSVCRQVIQRIRSIIDDDFQQIGLVHGDMHGRNILVDDSHNYLNVSITDFGWSSCTFFLDDECIDDLERIDHQRHLTEHFDLNYFNKWLATTFPDLS
jgi:glycerol-3-phosphate cytidylyltransferase